MRPDHDRSRDAPSEKSFGTYVLLRLAPDDTPPANETEETGCHEDNGTRLRNWRRSDCPLEIADPSLIEIDYLSAVQCEVAGAREEHWTGLL